MSLDGAYDPGNIFAKIIRGEASAIKIFEDDETPSNSKASLPSLQLHLDVPALGDRRPNRMSSASGFLICSWITRASGRAP
jgi:hypothetical protein